MHAKGQLVTEKIKNIRLNLPSKETMGCIFHIQQLKRRLKMADDKKNIGPEAEKPKQSRDKTSRSSAAA